MSDHDLAALQRISEKRWNDILRVRFVTIYCEHENKTPDNLIQWQENPEPFDKGPIFAVSQYAKLLPGFSSDLFNNTCDENEDEFKKILKESSRFPNVYIDYVLIRNEWFRRNFPFIDDFSHALVAMVDFQVSYSIYIINDSLLETRIRAVTGDVRAGDAFLILQIEPFIRRDGSLSTQAELDQLHRDRVAAVVGEGLARTLSTNEILDIRQADEWIVAKRSFSYGGRVISPGEVVKARRKTANGLIRRNHARRPTDDEFARHFDESRSQ